MKFTDERLTMQIAIPIFERLTALDAIGPYEVLQRLPGAEVVFIGLEKGSVRTENGFLGLTVDATLDEVPNPDIVVMPGGIGTRDMLGPNRFIDWLQRAHTTSMYTTSVCSGSLVLGAAGLLKGLTATSHWSCHEALAQFGAVPTAQRVVEHLDERIITSAGVSSGIDMALRLSQLLFDDTAAKAMQVMIEYDPQPPFDAGSVSKAGPEVMARAAEYSATKR